MTTIDNATGAPVPDPEPAAPDNVVQMPGTKRAARERVKRTAETIRKKGLAAAEAADAAVQDASAAVNETIDAGAHAINAGAQAFNALGDLGKWVLIAAGVWILFHYAGDGDDEGDEK